MYEQEKVVNDIVNFLERWGLKQKYVACQCNIKETIFSKFLNHKLALSRNQLLRVNDYMNNYISKNS